jgi:murein DD-endopeptidase MepM/ murein hydrolase activator NlpD
VRRAIARLNRPELRLLLAVGLFGFAMGVLLTAFILVRYDGLLGRGGAPGPDARARRPEIRHGEAVAPAPRGTAGVASAGPTIADPNAAALADRDLLIPVKGVSSDRLARSFHAARDTNREHEAIDILAPRNTPVLAVEDGRVAKLAESRAGGTSIYQFDPSGQYCYYYAHLQRYADGLREGTPVQRGQIIGFVGTSGNAPENTPHLHFAIFRLGPDRHWWEGAPIDPYDVLR